MLRMQKMQTMHKKKKFKMLYKKKGLIKGLPLKASYMQILKRYKGKPIFRRKLMDSFNALELVCNLKNTVFDFAVYKSESEKISIAVMHEDSEMVLIYTNLKTRIARCIAFDEYNNLTLENKWQIKSVPKNRGYVIMLEDLFRFHDMLFEHTENLTIDNYIKILKDEAPEVDPEIDGFEDFLIPSGISYRENLKGRFPNIKWLFKKEVFQITLLNDRYELLLSCNYYDLGTVTFGR